MDWHPTPFAPNLKFALELKEDLKTKYFEQHEKAKQALESFSCSLHNVYHEHQKLLADNVELSITIEKLKQIISKNESNQQPLSLQPDKKLSQILGASPNCNAKVLLPKISTSNKKINSQIPQDILLGQKENINELVPIFSSDFNSDIEDESFRKHKSPPPSITGTPVKIQSSPVLSKRKRLTSKRNNSSSISNNSSHSLTSSTASTLEKNINELDNDSDKELEKEFNQDFKEPLKTIENTFLSSTPSSQNKNKDYSVLGVSKTTYGKTEFIDKGKKLRQTVLTLKKVVPIIDISKVDFDENLSKNDSKSKFNNSGHKSPSTNNSISTNWNNTKEDYFRKTDLESVNTKNNSNRIKCDLLNQYHKMLENENTSAKEAELIETSPAYNEKSKLRNKFSLNKKTEAGKIKVKTPSSINSEKETNFKNIHQDDVTQFDEEFSNKLSKQNECGLKNNGSIFKPSGSKTSKVKNSCNVAAEKQKSFEPQRTFSDDTYFSPAELSDNKHNINDYEMDVTEFEDEIKCKTPPAKRILLDSFDIIPGRKEKSPDYAYKEAPVRKKNERAQLPGWDCRDCEKWYGHLPEEERKQRQNQCSKHRGKYKADILTPESFWNPVFDDTNDSSSFGD